MQLQKRLYMLFLAIYFVLAMSMTVYAHEAPDMAKTGSVSVTMIYEGNTVPGGTLTLYQAGEISENNGSYSFVPAEAFKESGVSLNDLSSASLASDLAAYVSANSLTGVTVEIGNDGKATADGLTLGLYLVVQTRAADGYEKVAPFLVSVPMNEGGSYLYNVDAAPKMSTLTKSTPDTPTVPTASSETALPQTGQLNWPVPVLAAAGVCLFLTGWALQKS